MAVKEPMICQIAKDTYAINEYGLSAMYLLVGSERALLIDAGCGTLDLKAIISSLTDKPYDVVLTHNHGDHIGGIPQFESVWIHKNDADGLLPVNWKMLTDYVDILGKMGTYKTYDISPNDVHRDDSEPEIKYLQVERSLIWAAAGSLALLRRSGIHQGNAASWIIRLVCFSVGMPAMAISCSAGAV